MLTSPKYKGWFVSEWDDTADGMIAFRVTSSTGRIFYMATPDGVTYVTCPGLPEPRSITALSMTVAAISNYAFQRAFRANRGETDGH